MYVAMLIALWGIAGGEVRGAGSEVLENALVRVVIDPAVGRVMEFTPKSTASRNLLWTNDPQSLEREAAQAGGAIAFPSQRRFWFTANA